jgi:microcystin-dependent protein
MTYTKTIWLEYGMDSTATVAALNNLETMYSETITYIDALTHSDSYYTDAQAAALFFTAATDGSGTSLIAATLDGYTAQQIIDAGAPSGTIAFWSGTEASIPAGWRLCDYNPDLRDRFVVGAGGNYVCGSTGGSNVVTTSATVTIATHVLTAAEIPIHSHGTITDNYAVTGVVWLLDDGLVHELSTQSTVDTETSNTGGGGAHTHSGSTWNGTDDQVKCPPFYALCYIIKE